MAKLLYITANPKPKSQAISLRVGEAFIQAYQAIHPFDQIIRLDLMKQPPAIDEDILAAREQLRQGEPFRDLNAVQQQKLYALHQLADQFSQADKWVFVSPVWNWGIPAVLKSFLDAVCVPDKTIKWTLDGTIGLLERKKALHIQSCGYRLTDEDRANEFSHSYLSYVLRKMGVNEVDFLLVNGLWELGEDSEEVLQEAIDRAERMAIEF